jgi:type IV pilus assembly protein PilE
MQYRMRGMSLIELMVVVAIVALLATIAVPSYRQFLLRSHRAEATSALLNLAAAQEKFYLQNNTYSVDLSTAPPAGLGLPPTTVNGHFTVVIDAANAAGFTATATTAGGQAQDTHCATFTINQAGARTATSADCW